MRVSKRLRDEAILICAVAASAQCPPIVADSIAVALDVDDDARELADQAWDHVAIADQDARPRAIWAEAEAMLQCNWSPP